MELVSGLFLGARPGEELAKPLGKEKHQAVAKHRGVFLPRLWPSSMHKNGMMLPGVLQPQQEKVQQKAVAKGQLKEAKVEEKLG